MTDQMSLRTAMRSTPATREFTDDDVADEVIYEILDDARFAPNGGNRQGWHVIVIRDPMIKRRIAESYELGMREYVGHIQAGLVPFVASEAFHRNPAGGSYDPAIDLEAARQVPLPNGFPEYLATAPVLLVLTLDLSGISAVDSGLDRLSIAAGASIYPFAHNILLGARARGLGGHFTSVLAREEPALRNLLHIPDQHVLATMLPIGRPVREITKLNRIPVEQFAHRETADGPVFSVSD
jgi:nitroreductase